MIRPNMKKLDRYGVQGRLSFDPTLSSANPIVYNEIKKFIMSERGLAGSGGDPANKFQTGKGFQASHVFNSPEDRDAVTGRLNQQFTQFLRDTYGGQAAERNMSIPAFLQTQGIHGIQQFGSGKDASFSAYHPDDFKQVSFNPLTGSTEKMIKAYAKMKGAMPQISGGTNEKRRMSLYARPEDEKYISSMLNTSKKKLATGTYSKGDLEAIYGTSSQKAEIKSLQTITKNNNAINLLDDEDSPVASEMRSKILKQQKEKELYNKTYQGMVDKGEITDDRKRDKTSPAVAAAKGFMGVLSSIKTVLLNIRSFAATMAGLLKDMAVSLGKLVMDAASTGIDPQLAKRMQMWGQQNIGFTQGNENLALDATKAFNTQFGNIVRLGKNADFGEAGFLGKASTILRPLIESALKKSPEQGMNDIFGGLAQQYVSAKDKKGELHEQTQALTSVFGETVSSFYVALLKAAEAQGRLTKDKAKNLFRDSFSIDNVRAARATGVNWYKYLPASDLQYSVEEKAKKSSELAGEIEQFKQALKDVLANRLDLVKTAMENLVKALLWLGSVFNPSMKVDYDNFVNETNKEGFKNFQGTLETNFKTKSWLDNKIETFIDKVSPEHKAGVKQAILQSLVDTGNLSEFEKSAPNWKKKIDSKEGQDIVLGYEYYKTLSQRVNDYKYGSSNPETITALRAIELSRGQQALTNAGIKLSHAEYYKRAKELAKEIEKTPLSKEELEQKARIEQGKPTEPTLKEEFGEVWAEIFMQYFLPRKSKKNSTNLNRVLQTPDFIPANLPGTLLKSLVPDTKNMASAGGTLNNSSEMTYNLNLTINGKEQLKATNVLNGEKQKYLANNNSTFRIGG